MTGTCADVGRGIRLETMPGLGRGLPSGAWAALVGLIDDHIRPPW